MQGDTVVSIWCTVSTSVTKRFQTGRILTGWKRFIRTSKTKRLGKTIRGDYKGGNPIVSHILEEHHKHSTLEPEPLHQNYFFCESNSSLLICAQELSILTYFQVVLFSKKHLWHCSYHTKLFYMVTQCNYLAYQICTCSIYTQQMHVRLRDSWAR